MQQHANDDEARTSNRRKSGNPLYLGLTARERTQAKPNAAATAAPSSLVAPVAATSVPASSPLSLTFRDHMDSARKRWIVQATRPGMIEIEQQREAPRRPASAAHWAPTAAAPAVENGYEHSVAATIAPSPPVRPASSYTHKRNTASAAASVRPASAHSHTPLRPAPPSAAPATPASAALPLRATNLTHVAKAGVPYSGELFYPFGRNADPFEPQSAQQHQQHQQQLLEQDEWEESKDNTAISSTRHSSLYRHRPLRYYRGWVKCVPARDDAEEERVYTRNLARGVVPPLKTITAQVIRHQPLQMGSATTRVKAGTATQRPKSAASALESSSRLQQQLQQQQQQAQHVAAVLASNALLAARWASQPHMSHTEINPAFAPLSSAAADCSAADSSERSQPSAFAPPPLLDDKNEFDAQRLLRAPRASGATTTAAQRGGAGLQHELACNAAPPAGRVNPSDFYAGSSRAFSALFPATADFGGPVPAGLYVSESALSFREVDPRRVRINLALATRGPGARVVEMDARAKSNHRMARLMRGNYHQQSKLKKDKSGRAYEA